MVEAGGRTDDQGAWHARLSASESKRWMACPGSVNLIDTLPPEMRRRSSWYADQGTAAHALAELCLKTKRSAKSYLTKEVAGFEVDLDMAGAVQEYLDEVKDQTRRYPKAETFTERRLDASWFDPDMGGTADRLLSAIWDRFIMTDYKHGKGVPVEVEWNSQLMIYTFLSAQLDDFQYDTAELVVAQPRAPHADGGVRRWEIPMKDLKEWGFDVLGPAARATREPDAKLASGDHCRWCPAAATCPKIAEDVAEEVLKDFNDVEGDMTAKLGHNGGPAMDEDHAEVLAKALEKLPAVKAWCKSVSQTAYVAAEAGLKIPRWKLVAGKEGDRKFGDEKKAARAFKKAGVGADQLYDTRMKSPAQAEKLLAVKGEERKAFMAELTTRSPGKRTLAKETDPRPAVDPADDFAGVEDGDYAD